MALFFSTQHYSERIEQLDVDRVVATDHCVEDYIDRRVAAEVIIAHIDEVFGECVADPAAVTY